MTEEHIFDWFASVSGHLRNISDQYDQQMRGLEQQRRSLQGQQRKQIDDIKRIKEQLCQNLSGGNENSLNELTDSVSVWLAQDRKRKKDARQCYIDQAARGKLHLPPALSLDPWPPTLLDERWLALDIAFTLQSPWYSRDDRIFHVLDNPLRKDRVFGVPFMAAASWKGMLRWSCRMHAGLVSHLEKGKSFEQWRDPDWIIHLFGNPKGEQDDFLQGALVFYPTWFDKIGFEVINPHDRERRAGTQPIVYEVVPAETQARLRLLYAPSPGVKNPIEPWMSSLIESIESLLTRYGISAKRTAGWGTAQIAQWTVYKYGQSQPVTAQSISDLKQQLRLQ